MPARELTRAPARSVELRRQLRRAGTRSALRALEFYARGVALRGSMVWPEVRALRVMLDWQLTRPQLGAPADTRVETVRFRRADGQVRGEWVEAPGIATRDDAVLLYVHGGAFVAGSTRSHRGLVAELSARTRRSAFSVDYRLAPEHRFPAAADDVLRAYEWLLARGVPAGRIVVAGDSAGGHLALGLGPRAIRAGLPVPAGIVAFSPVVDVSMALCAAYEREHGRDRMLAGADAGRAAIGLYHRGTPPDHPELTLTGDDLSGMPPVLIQASSTEMLADDARHYAAALEAAGGDVRLRFWPRQYHVFQVAHRLSRSASEALDDAAAFVADVAGPGSGPAPLRLRRGRDVAGVGAAGDEQGDHRRGKQRRQHGEEGVLQAGRAAEDGVGQHAEQQRRRRVPAVAQERADGFGAAPRGRHDDVESRRVERRVRRAEAERGSGEQRQRQRQRPGDQRRREQSRSD
jgi:acetyl esterase/lipase